MKRLLSIPVILMLLIVAHVGAQSEGPTVAAAPAQPVVKTDPVQLDPGPVTGLVIGEKQDVRAFKGIPFAAPPVGDLRWRPPQPVQPWKETRECVKFGNASIQPQPPMQIPIPGFDINASQSEDCLYLNVWTSAKKNNEKLPVMVWIHGGGYVIGAASQPLYDGEHLARLGVVVVSVNYRLGPLGFAAHPALTAESEKHSSGNYGILDQIAGLEWVQKNIATFGGDPGNVTIFGESAGGGSVVTLLVSPLAKGLFHRAIAQSAPIMTLKHLNQSWYGYDSMEKIGGDIAAKLGLQDKSGPDLLKALRAVPADQLMQVAGAAAISSNMDIRADLLKYAPIVDGWVVPDSPNRMLREGRQHNVPVIVGSNKDEGTIFMAMGSPVRDVEGYQNFVRDGFGENADAILKFYPAATAAEVRGAMSAAVRDYVFVLEAREVARGMENVKSKAWRYQFGHAAASGLGKMMGAYHGAEIPYVFNNLSMLKNPDDTDRMLAQAISGYFVQFAKKGNPNGNGLPKWPAYKSKSEKHLEFGSEILPGTALNNEPCDLMEKIIEARNPPAN